MIHNRSFVSSDEELTTLHGGQVFEMAKNFAPHASFSFYQVIDEDGEMPIAAFSDGISAAIEDQVDIVNISAGTAWRGPMDANPYVKEAKRLTKEKITVVAAAGNDYHQESLPVHCPALLDEIIAVGGCETICPSSHNIAHTTPMQGPYYARPEEGNGVEVDASDTYCGWQGCENGQGCLSQNSDQPWAGNPRRKNNKPEILAPIHYLISEDNGFAFAYGTSFASPIVAGVLAEAYGNLRHEGYPDPNPAEFKKAIQETSNIIEYNFPPKLNEFKIEKYIKESIREPSANTERSQTT